MVNISKYSKFKFYKEKKNGFSIVEILLVLAIFFFIVFLSLPLVSGVFMQSDLEDNSLLIVSTIRQAENNSRNGLEDSVWGIKVDGTLGIVLFKGMGTSSTATYATRDPAYDLTLPISNNLTLSGISEVVFSKLEAVPSTTGNIIITNLNTKSITININEKGSLSY